MQVGEPCKDPLHGVRPLPYQQMPVRLTESDLIALLQTADPTEDVERILRRRGLMSGDAIGYANVAALKPQFKDWLHSGQPCLILVDGCCREEGVGRTSPMSIFTASLASALLQTQPIIVLQFFCGHHVDPNSPQSGPKGLLRSIIVQLLLYPKPCDLVLEFIDQDLLNLVSEGAMEALCFLFEGLFWQIDPTTTVYVLVDSVSDFESDFLGFGQEMDRLFVLFRKLIGDVRHGSFLGPRMKLFMASANRSHRISRQVDRATEYVRLNTGSVRDSLRPRDRFLGENRRARSSDRPSSRAGSEGLSSLIGPRG